MKTSSKTLEIKAALDNQILAVLLQRPKDKVWTEQQIADGLGQDTVSISSLERLQAAGLVKLTLDSNSTYLTQLYEPPEPLLAPAPLSHVSPGPTELPHIHPEVLAALKRLYPASGPDTPDWVKYAAAREETAGWHWDCGSGECQWEIEVYSPDTESTDPVGFVVIRPVGDKYVVIFDFEREWPAEWPKELNPDPEDLTFPVIEWAKKFLDELLATSTPPIPAQD
jgi:hypothetical protein